VRLDGPAQHVRPSPDIGYPLDADRLDERGVSSDCLGGQYVKHPSSSRDRPDRILDTLLYARFRGDALAAAIDLDFFTAVGGASDVAALAERCGAAERGLRALCDFLVAAGFLTGGWGRYGLTPDSGTFLDRRSRAYIGGARGFMASPQAYRRLEPRAG
jgi:hypothetical protein